MPQTSPKLIRVGHSPDADDAFMFYALAKKKVDMRGFEVEHVIEDIESLNQRALASVSTPGVGHSGPPYLRRRTDPSNAVWRKIPGVSLEVTAVSCHAYAYLADRYAVMRSGASVGDGYGPILVQRATGNAQRNKKKDNPRKKVAIPGKLTTAYLVLQLYSLIIARCALRGFEPVFMPFDRILDAVKSGKVDYGLVIHEGQITYAEHGLEKVLDLGAWWHEKTKLPLPLGVDIIRKDLGLETMRSFAELFKESIEYALSHRQEALEYARQFGRGISGDLNDRFVGMYVNERTVDIGKDGEAGFRRLLGEAYQHKIIPERVKLEFI